MKRYVSYSVLVLFIFLAGCMGSKFDNDEVAAVVRGTEITVGDVRFLHGDENIENNLYLLIYNELAKQKVEELNLDTSAEWETHSIFVKELPPK